MSFTYDLVMISFGLLSPVDGQDRVDLADMIAHEETAIETTLEMCIVMEGGETYKDQKMYYPQYGEERFNAWICRPKTGE